MNSSSFARFDDNGIWNIQKKKINKYYSIMKGLMKVHRAEYDSIEEK
jgi:hypothetical protein